MTRRENYGRSRLLVLTLASGIVFALALGASAARADTAESVTVLIAAKAGQTDGVVSGVKSLGGTVTGKDTDIGYVKAELPAGRYGKVGDLSSVKSFEVDRIVPIDDPAPQGQTNPIPQTPPDASTPRTNPYMPLQDVGSDDFTSIADRDGRGTTIAVLDTGVDLANPALQETTTSDPKVIDWFNANPPGQDGTWVATEGRLNGQFTRLGKTWTAPPLGPPYAFGTLVENRQDLAGGELGGDLDRDGVKGETIGVLQNRFTLETYVDTDEDRDFTDETPMKDYKLEGDIGTLGVDNPGTPIAEDLTFTVQTNRSDYDNGKDAGSWVDIGIAGGSHGSHVAGITAANGMFGGDMGGAAPGAQVISVQVCQASEGCLNSAMMDGMIYAAEHGADVANMSVGGLPALNDGSGTRADLYNRLIRETGMQIFISAGNDGSGANSVGDPGTTSDVVSVGASITKETWLANYGFENTIDQMLMAFSSRGPSEAGAMKPDLVAPGSAISTIQPWLPGDPLPGAMTLPPGYAMYNGTSMSSPQAAGAAALLIGAYKNQFGSKPSPVELRNAMISTADFMPDSTAYGQGTGVLDVEAAWNQLSQVAPVQPPVIKPAVTVNSVLSDSLRTPGRGTGIYEREGLQAGEHMTRNYTLTRTSGVAGSENFDISWKGNDGTFDTAAGVNLPLNTPVMLPVDIDPASTGIHSAVLQFDDPATNGIDLNTQNVVFATEPAPGFTVEDSGTIGRADSQSVLIDVPEGTSSLRVEIEGGGPDPADGQVRFLRYSPSGEQLDPVGTRECLIPPSPTGCSTGLPGVRTVEDPEPGVWEIAVEGGYRSSAQDSAWDLKASILDASVSPDPDHIRTGGEAVTRTYEVTNSGGAFVGLLAGAPLESTRVERPTISGTADMEFPLTVPAGAESVGATIGNPSDPVADLDLYLVRCEGAVCEQLDASETATSEESVRVKDPEPGEYKVQVAPYDLNGGPVAFDYSDFFASPDLGEITTDDTAAERDTGDVWTAHATISPGDVAPTDGRTVTGEVRVIDETGSRIATGAIDVDLDTVGPAVTFTRKPDASSTDRTPVFEFVSDEPGAPFECSLDEGPWAACTSPYTAPSLSVGDHTFAVRAADDLGNVGEASFDFTVDDATVNPPVDRTPPKFIGKVKMNPRSPKAGTRPRIKFRTSESATLTVRVGGKVVRRTVSLKTRSIRLPRLQRGRYTARLVLTDAAKNRSKVRKIRFRVR